MLDYAYLIQYFDGIRMSPETIVYGDIRYPFSLHPQRGQHHVTRIQRMDVVRWKSILLLYQVRHAEIENHNQGTNHLLVHANNR